MRRYATNIVIFSDIDTLVITISPSDSDEIPPYRCLFRFNNQIDLSIIHIYWARKNGSITRNQAHGSPANLIDVYAAVDIPECEGFGLSQFHIKGLRQDSLTKKNDSDLSMLKYASSAAHIAGKPYTSTETFTWLTEHFRTSLSQCKPDMDLMFVSGINHMFFHGTRCV